MAIIQVVKNNVVITVMLVADDVTISADGKTLVGVQGGDIPIPEEEAATSFYMKQDGAGVGWTYDGGTGELSPPPPTEPIPELVSSADYFEILDQAAARRKVTK